MRRREFITGLGSAAAWPVPARAQQPTMPVIGYLGTQSAELDYKVTDAFLQGLKETGYVDLSSGIPFLRPRPTGVGGRRAQGLSRSAVALAWRHAQSFPGRP
jgi:hypothetical protein